MTKDEKSVLAAGKTTLEVMDNHGAVWKDEEDIVAKKTYITSVVKHIDEKELEQAETDTVGHTDVKDDLKEKVIKKTLKVALGIYLYADNAGKLDLKHDTDLSRNRLVKGGVKEMVIRSKKILKRGQDNIAVLGKWKVKSEDLVELDKLIVDLEKKIVERDGVGKENELATLNIGELVKLLRSELKRLNKSVKGLVADEDFVVLVQKSVKINDGRGKGGSKG